ncbi:MAG: hypothetical protein ACREJG_14380 [Candidatus Rokuibacteriota bacterium]
MTSVRWTSRPSISFLRPPAAVRALIGGLGLRERAWLDESATSLRWLRERMAAAAGAPPPVLGLHVILGPDAAPMLGNVARSLEEERIVVVKGLWER